MNLRVGHKPTLWFKQNTSLISLFFLIFLNFSFNNNLLCQNQPQTKPAKADSILKNQSATPKPNTQTSKPVTISPKTTTKQDTTKKQNLPSQPAKPKSTTTKQDTTKKQNLPSQPAKPKSTTTKQDTTKKQNLPSQPAKPKSTTTKQDTTKKQNLPNQPPKLPSTETSKVPKKKKSPAEEVPTPAPPAYRPNLNKIVQTDSDYLLDLLKSNPEYFEKFLREPDRYRLQIILTQVLRDKFNRPTLKHHTYNLDTLLYFWPASIVKLPCAALALEKINELKPFGVNRNTHIEFKKGFACQFSTTPAESSKKYGYPTITHYIKDALVASGNLSYSRLYEFLGQKDLNERLWQKGYLSSNITQRYSTYCTNRENRVTNPFVFLKKDSVIYKQDLVENPKELRKELKGLNIGKGKRLADGSLRYEPVDFTGWNFISLKDIHKILIAIMMPQTVSKRSRFNLTKEDYQVLWRYLSMYPTESKDPVFDPSYYTATRLKYLLYGNQGTPDSNIRVFNKVGLAWGFLTDCAYIVDFESKTEFFLSATIFCNSSEIMDENHFEYWSVGMPFLKRLGQVVLQAEQKRKKKFIPDLKEYRLDYSKY